MTMFAGNREADQTAPQTEPTKAAGRRYASPELHVVGTATALVQGCGGMSGQDRNYYYHFCR